jgi:hypothetical protein
MTVYNLEMWAGPGAFIPMLPPHGFPSASASPPRPSGFPGAGHRIPMLSDEPSPEFCQPPLQPIPPNVSDCLPRTGGVDWSLIASCSPETVAETNDVSTLSAVLETFVRAEFTPTEAQLFPNPLSAKLFRLLQIGVHHLLDCQDELREAIDECDRSRAALSAKVKSLTTSLERARTSQARRSEAIAECEKCVVCGKKFRSVGYLDAHFERRHSALIPAWRSLRTGEAAGQGALMEEIAELRAAVARTNLELAKRAQPVPPVTRAAPVPPQPAATAAPPERWMEDLTRKQDELMEQARLQEEKQLSFRREIRNQLDDAVMALRESHRDFVAEAQKIAKLPPIPPAPSASGDDLAASLTGKLVRAASVPEHPQPSQMQPRVKIAESEDKGRRGGFDATKRRVTTDLDRLLHEAEERPEIAVSETLQRQMRQDQILAALDVEEEEEEEEPEPALLPRPEANEQLILRAQQLIAHTPDFEDSPRKDQAISAITSEVLTRVDKRLNELKKRRSYAPLSVPYIHKKLSEAGKDYQPTYERMKLFVASKVPSAGDIRRHLFKERQTRFPVLPTIPTAPEGTAQAGGDRVPSSIGPSAQAITAAVKKLPFKQRQHRKRPLGMPADQVVDEVSAFSSEIPSSESTVPYLEDTNYYQRKKEAAELAIDSSPVIEPLKDPAEVLDFGGFAELSSSGSFDDGVQTTKAKETVSRPGTATKELTMKAGAETQELKATDLAGAKTVDVPDDLIADISSDNEKPTPLAKPPSVTLDSDNDDTF